MGFGIHEVELLTRKRLRPRHAAGGGKGGA